MSRATVRVLVIVMALMAAIVVVALWWKGDVRAGAKFGEGSFFIEVAEKKTAPSQTR